VEDKWNFKYIFPYPPKNLWKNVRKPLQYRWKFSYLPPSSIINSVLTFVLRLSIFWNSPVCDNSPTSCSCNHILNIFRSLRFVTSLFWFWRTSDGLRVRTKKFFLVYFRQKKIASIIQCDTCSSGSNGVSLLALTIQMYQICTPKVALILNPTYHLTLSQSETYIVCVDLIRIIVKQFFPKLNLGTNTFNIQQ
jgi:hypothetical protein